MITNSGAKCSLDSILVTSASRVSKRSTSGIAVGFSRVFSVIRIVIAKGRIATTPTRIGLYGIGSSTAISLTTKAMTLSTTSSTSRVVVCDTKGATSN